MKLFLITLACLCAVALAGSSVEEESYRRRGEVAKTDASKKQKKDIQRQTWTAAKEDNKELNKEHTNKFKKHGFEAECTDKLNLKNQHKNTVTVNREHERDWEKNRKKTFRRTKDLDYRRRSASCSNSHSNERSCSGSSSSDGRRGRYGRRCGCGGWGGCGYYPYGNRWGCYGRGRYGCGYPRRCGCSKKRNSS